MGGIAALFLLLYNLMVSRNPLPLLFEIFFSKQILVDFFLKIKVSPFDFTWKPFCSARVTLNIFACRPGIMVIFYNVTRWIFLSSLWYSCQLLCFVQVIFLLFPMVTHVSLFLRFVIFSSEFTICEVAT